MNPTANRAIHHRPAAYPVAVVFFALLGGLAAFGSIGLIVGPLVVSMFLSLLQMYHRDFSPHKHDVPDVPGSDVVPVDAPDPGQGDAPAEPTDPVEPVEPKP